MTKAELEWQFNQFTSYAQQCDSYHRAGAFFGSLDSASVSLSFADGMLQYSKRFGAGPPRSVGTVDYIIYYAPLLFHRVSLQRLEDSISASRRLAKGETWDYSGAVSAALKRMELARKLWNILDERGELEHRQVTAIFGSAGQSVQHIVNPSPPPHATLGPAESNFLSVIVMIRSDAPACAALAEWPAGQYSPRFPVGWVLSSRREMLAFGMVFG
jgi:hypothetical protein